MELRVQPADRQGGMGMQGAGQGSAQQLRGVGRRGRGEVEGWRGWGELKLAAGPDDQALAGADLAVPVHLPVPLQDWRGGRGWQGLHLG